MEPTEVYAKLRKLALYKALAVFYSRVDVALNTFSQFDQAFACIPKSQLDSFVIDSIETQRRLKLLMLLNRVQKALRVQSHISLLRLFSAKHALKLSPDLHCESEGIPSYRSIFARGR